MINPICAKIPLYDKLHARKVNSITASYTRLKFLKLTTPFLQPVVRTTSSKNSYAVGLVFTK